jgi:hypothetical protein
MQRRLYLNPIEAQRKAGREVIESETALFPSSFSHSLSVPSRHIEKLHQIGVIFLIINLILIIQCKSEM